MFAQPSIDSVGYTMSMFREMFFNNTIRLNAYVHSNYQLLAAIENSNEHFFLKCGNLLKVFQVVPKALLDLLTNSANVP